jgi:cobalt/nickel transport system ATP-binding protein
MAVDVCERTIVICEGSVTADGSTLKLFQDEALLERSNLEKPLRMQSCPVCSARDKKVIKIGI